MKRLQALMIITFVCVLSSALAWAQLAQERISGELVVLEDGPNGITFALRTQDHGTLEILLDASQGGARRLQEAWKHIKTGMNRTLRGSIEHGKLLIRSTDLIDPRQQDGKLTLEELLPNTTGIQAVLFILTLPVGTHPVYTPAFAHHRMQTDVHAALQEFSFGQMGLAVTTTPWLPIALANDSCSIAHTFQLAEQAEAAAVAAGYVLGNYQRFVYAHPLNEFCVWAGMGTIGGNPSRSWMNGEFGISIMVATHELGHNLGLFHGHSCRVLGSPALTWPCNIDDVGDYLNTMGQPPTDLVTGERAYPHFGAFQKDLLGWIGGSGPAVIEGVSSGVYTLSPYAEDSPLPKALKLRYPGTTPEAYYWIEARRAVGSDAFLTQYPDIIHGVTLHIADANDGHSSFLLDAHPQTFTWNDAALTLGETYTEPNAHWSVHVLTAGPDGSEVAISLPTDEISLGLLSPFVQLWHVGQTLRIDVQVLVGTQPAGGALWEWAVDIPGLGFFLQTPEILGPDGQWHIAYPLVAGEIPTGLYTLYARASWENKVTPIASGQFFIVP